MIDLHSHIIPSLDDGAKTWDETVAMCRASWKDGVKAIVATPHMFNGLYDYTSADIAVQITILRERLESEGIVLDVYQGAEVYARPDLVAVLSGNPALTMDGNNRFFLMEFPHSILPPNADHFVFDLVVHNLIPVIVHPERNVYLQTHIDILEGLLRQGALCQITGMSLTGGFGARAQACAHELLRRNCVHAVASDTHNLNGRPPILSRARQCVMDQFGAAKAEKLFETVPKKILDGEW